MSTPKPSRSAATSAHRGRIRGAPRARHRTPPGELDIVLTPRPQFGLRIRGYDRLEVDNYVAWVEKQLAAAEEVADQALARYGACAAEAQELSRRLADHVTDRSLSEFSARIRTILQLAAEEAVEMRLAAATQAEQIITQAHADAAAVLEQARCEAARSAMSSTSGS